MKEILKLCDGFVTGPTPQVTSILIYGSECFIQYVSSDFNVLFVTDSSFGQRATIRYSLTEILTSSQPFWTFTGCIPPFIRNFPLPH